MYQALYRKYRPRTFDDVVGQEHITETLKKQVASGRLSHAYLFIGTRGTGKTTCAKILAKAVNCERPVNGNPCGECAACRGIDDGSVMDVVEIDAASNNGVENVRALRDEAVYSPASVKKRVYIIDEVHMLSLSAFNALLKILEEPPEHLMFILATTELRKMPATILSRCQRYSFRRLDGMVICSRLNHVAEQEGLKLTSDAAVLLARLADGSMRDALSLLDQCSGVSVIDPDSVLAAMGLAGNSRVVKLLSAIAERDRTSVLRQFASLWSDGKDAAGLLSDLCGLMRDILILSVAPDGGEELISGGYDLDTLSSFSGRFTQAELLRNMDTIQATLATLRDNPSPRIAGELCLVSLCDPALTDGLPELRARISRLEERGTLAAVPTERPAPEAPPASKEPEPEPELEPELEIEPEFEPEPLPSFVPDNMDEEYYPPEPQRVWEPEEISGPDNAPDNEPAPAPEPAPITPAEGGVVTWSMIAEEMKKGLPIGLQNLLDDPLQICGDVADDTLELRFATGFASNMMNKPDMKESFRQTASRLAGREMTVTASDMDSTTSLEKRSLDELSKFGVKFK